MTGDVEGRTQLWQVLPASAEAALSLCGSGADGGGAVGGGAVQLLQQSGCGLMGGHLGGIAVAVALCAGAGYAAAATTCGEVSLDTRQQYASQLGAAAGRPAPWLARGSPQVILQARRACRAAPRRAAPRRVPV
jgi:hypothetical protein